MQRENVEREKTCHVAHTPVLSPVVLPVDATTSLPSEHVSVRYTLREGSEVRRFRALRRGEPRGSRPSLTHSQSATTEAMLSRQRRAQRLGHVRQPRLQVDHIERVCERIK